MTSSFKFDRLRRSKVFVVLDNVGDLEQLELLIGYPDQTKTRFGKGSRIIITSRDKKLLTDSADDIYEVGALKLDEATQLFYQNAFRRDSSRIMEYTELSKKFVNYAGGNPLALKVLGSHLHSRSVEDWESSLSKLRKSPNEKVQNVLKISYDALDQIEQSIFLGVACLLKGEHRKLVEDILGDGSHIAISVLIERSLITIVGGSIWMHDLIQEMGREVVRQESEKPGKRSWLWDTEDVCSVLKRNKGSAKVKGMCLDLSKISNDLRLRSTVFEALENLIFLKIHNSDSDRMKFVFPQGLDCLPDSLRYLHWVEYPLKSLPSAIEPQNLVKLHMSFSKLKKLWNGVQHLPNLKHINLYDSRYLIELPDLSQAPRLERVNLTSCRRLCRLPKISRNLQYLDMSRSGVEVFDPSLESAENHEFMNLDSCETLTSLPRNVRMYDCKSILLGLHSLTYLRMSGCHISHIPESFNLLSSLETLDMSSNDFERIPSSIKQMNKLKHLDVIYCENLESLPDLPSSLVSLRAIHCESLRMISVCGLTSWEWIDASDCKSLEEFNIDDATGCTSLEGMFQYIYIEPRISFYFGNCLKLKQGSQDNICTLFLRQTFRKNAAFRRGLDLKSRACYAGNEIPKWFTCESEGSSIHISLGHNVVGISVSAVLELEGPICFLNCEKPYLRIWSGVIKLMDCILTKVSLHLSIREGIRPHVHMWQFFFNNAQKKLLDSVTEASFDFKLTDDFSKEEIKIKKMGIRLIYLEEVEECNFSWQKADHTSPKPDEAPYSRRFKLKREEYGTDADTDTEEYDTDAVAHTEEYVTDADTGATTSSPGHAEEASSIGG